MKKWGIALISLVFLAGVAGCKSKYEKACVNGLTLGSKEDKKMAEKKGQFPAICKDGAKLYVSVLDCVAGAGKLSDLSKCSEKAMKEGQELAKKHKMEK